MHGDAVGSGAEEGHGDRLRDVPAHETENPEKSRKRLPPAILSRCQTQAHIHFRLGAQANRVIQRHELIKENISARLCHSLCHDLSLALEGLRVTVAASREPEVSTRRPRWLKDCPSNGLAIGDVMNGPGAANGRDGGWARW